MDVVALAKMEAAADVGSYSAIGRDFAVDRVTMFIGGGGGLFLYCWQDDWDNLEVFFLGLGDGVLAFCGDDFLGDFLEESVPWMPFLPLVLLLL